MRLVAAYTVIAALSFGCDLDSGKGGGAGGSGGAGGAAGMVGAGGAAGSTPVSCDDSGAPDCGSNERCVVVSQPLCGAPVPRVLCLPNVACDLQFDPVCGCDGMTYGNSCAATTSGIGIFHSGPCQ